MSEKVFRLASGKKSGWKSCGRRRSPQCFRDSA